MSNESIKGKVGKSMAFEEIFASTKSVEEMTETEVRQHLTTYRQWATWLTPDVLYWGSKIGELIRVAERMGEVKQGNYVGFTIKITEHKIEGFQRVYDQIRKKYYIQRYTSIIPASNIVDFAFISEENEEVEEKTL